MATIPPKPIRVWVTPPGPNPWKVIFLLEELGLNYEIKSFSFANVKEEPFININPNGRTPAIQDPNTNLTLWESGAICQYIIELYDTKHRLSYEGLNERHLCSQWLHFQMSGQGPDYGKCAWFSHLHPEKIDSAIKRYVGEINRVLGVLETVLAAKEEEKKEQWLVGDKMTYADMAFAPWNSRLGELLTLSTAEVYKAFPHVSAWQSLMVNLPSWKRSMDTRTKLMDEQELQWNGVPKGTETFNAFVKDIATGAYKKQ